MSRHRSARHIEPARSRRRRLAGRGARTACRSPAIDRAADTPCSIVGCVIRCMIRLRYDLKDGTTVPDQNHGNQSGAICAVPNAAVKIERGASSVRVAGHPWSPPAQNAAHRSSQEKDSVVNAALHKVMPRRSTSRETKRKHHHLISGRKHSFQVLG